MTIKSTRPAGRRGRAAKDAGEKPGRLVLCRDVPLAEALPAACAAVLGHAAVQRERAGRDPETAVHEYRKSVRRARAVVRLCRPVTGKAATRRLDHDLRDALRLASPLRDADVLLQTLTGLIPGLDANDEAREIEEARAFEITLGARVAASRAAADVPAVLAVGVGKIERVPEKFARALPAAVTADDLERGLARLVRLARRALDAACRTTTDDTIHGWRKRIKELRYALELFEGPGEKGDVHRRTAKLAEGLGEVTDLVILRRALHDASGATGLGDAIERRIRARFDDLAAEGRPLFAERPREIAHAILGERSVTGSSRDTVS